MSNGRLSVPDNHPWEDCDLSDDDVNFTKQSSVVFEDVSKSPSDGESLIIVSDATSTAVDAPELEMIRPCDEAAAEPTTSSLDDVTTPVPHKLACQCSACLHHRYCKATAIVRQFQHNPYAAVVITPQPAEVVVPPTPPPAPVRRMCCYFKQHGWCTKGDDCWYGHDGDLYTPCHYGSSCKAGHGTLVIMAGYDPLDELKSAPALAKKPPQAPFQQVTPLCCHNQKAWQRPVGSWARQSNAFLH